MTICRCCGREYDPRELTPRQTQVLSLLAYGLSNAQIALRVGITEKTIKGNITDLYGKLNVDNRVAAARWWWERECIAAQADKPAPAPVQPWVEATRTFEQL